MNISIIFCHMLSQLDQLGVSISIKCVGHSKHLFPLLPFVLLLPFLCVLLLPFVCALLLPFLFSGLYYATFIFSGLWAILIMEPRGNLAFHIGISQPWKSGIPAMCFPVSDYKEKNVQCQARLIWVHEF